MALKFFTGKKKKNNNKNVDVEFCVQDLFLE